jgi:hypothetical protein
MDTGKFDEYVASRYLAEISWYDKRAGFNKYCYVIFQWAAIVLSAVIPALTLALPSDRKLSPAILGVFLAIITAALKTFKLQENWINYRTIAETLKKEKHFYDAGIGDYRNVDDPQALFIERVETLISRENSLWITAQEKNNKGESKSQ